MRTFKIYSLSKFQILPYSFIHYGHHTVPYILRTYLFYNWMFGLLDPCIHFCLYIVLIIPPVQSFMGSWTWTMHSKFNWLTDFQINSVSTQQSILCTPCQCHECWPGSEIQSCICPCPFAYWDQLRVACCCYFSCCYPSFSLSPFF